MMSSTSTGLVRPLVCICSVAVNSDSTVTRAALTSTLAKLTVTSISSKPRTPAVISRPRVTVRDGDSMPISPV